VKNRKSKSEEPLPDIDVQALGVQMVNGAPRLMAEVIAIASGSRVDDPEFEADVDAAVDFSAGVQMDALTKIADLTFSSEMPPGKFLAVVVKLAASATAAMTTAPRA
jgi:hypothetical protein